MGTSNYIPREGEMNVSLHTLALDLPRMLSVQFREFIHHIEDHEVEPVFETNPGVVHFLERCWVQAA